MDRIGSVLPMELRLAAFRGQGLDRPGGRLLDLLFSLLVVRGPHDETVPRRTDVLDLYGDVVRLRGGLRQGLLDMDRPVRGEVRRLDIPVDRDVRRDDVLAGDLDERLHPRTLEALALEGALVHHALLERAVERPEGIEEVVPELLPALIDRLPEALGHDREQVLRLLLVLPFLDLLAALVLVDRLEGEVDVPLVRVHLQDLADDLLALADVVPDVLDPAGGHLRDVDEALLALVLVQGHERAEVLHVRHDADDELAFLGPFVRSRRGRRRSARCHNPRTSRGGTGCWASGSLVDLHELELLRADPGALMGLLAFAAAEPQMDPLRRLLTTLGLRPREAPVPGRDAAESSLSGPEFRPRSILHALDFELHVLVAEGTVTADTLGHLHGIEPNIEKEGIVLLKGCWPPVGSVSGCPPEPDRTRPRAHRPRRIAPRIPGCRRLN